MRKVPTLLLAAVLALTAVLAPLEVASAASAPVPKQQASSTKANKKCKRHGKRHKCHKRGKCKKAKRGCAKLIPPVHPSCSQMREQCEIVQLPLIVDCNENPAHYLCDRPEEVVDSGCAFVENGCSLAISQPWIIYPGGKGPSQLTACVQVYGLAGGEVEVKFHAEDGVFGPVFSGGTTKGWQGYCAHYYEQYDKVHPQSGPPPASYTDEVWVEVKEFTGEKTGRFVESERITFPIIEPEESETSESTK